MNNLYGSSLSMKLPKSDFQWMTDSELDDLMTKLKNIDLDGEIGYYVEVDISHPYILQDETDELPFAPEKFITTSEDMPEFMKQQWKDVSTLRYGSIKDYRGTSKLVLNHYKKSNYPIHAKLLQFYLNKGLKIHKIHRGIKFTQEGYFEKYISDNSSKRKKAENDFEKDYYKLKNNSLYGKSVENVKKRKNYRLINDMETMKTIASRAEFQEGYIFSENLVGALLVKEAIVLSKPIFIGQAVLDLSKLMMYQLK